MPDTSRRPSVRISARSSTLVALAGVLVLLLAACGGPSGPSGPPEPEGPTKVKGAVSLPADLDVDLASLSVTTAMGTFPITADGEFEADILGSASTELGIQTASGDLLLLGVSDGADVAISITSTAEALLYYLAGGMWLPDEQQDKVRELLRGAPEAAGIAAELERLLQNGSNGLAEPDTGLLAAFEAAHAELLGDARLEALTADAAQVTGTGLPALGPAASEASNITIEPNTMRGGAMMLLNPAGSGVVAQNHVRRPAALLAYEVAWDDADDVEHQVDPPLLVETVDVPATGQLEFLNALVDVVTGNSPWSPVLSEKVALAGHEGASRTHYQLVLLGPATSGVEFPIMSDERFSGFHDEWDEVVTEKSVELFLDDLLLPLIEVYGLGSMAKFDAAKLKAMRDRVRVIHDKHLLQLGIYLKEGRVGYAQGLKFLIQELVENRTYRLDMMEMVKEALEESDNNKAAIVAMEKRLAGRASASAITAAVQTVLVGGDVAKIMYDLAGVPTAIDWTAVSAPSLFALAPAEAIVTKANASAKFTVIPKGETTGNYVFRWTTSGTHGDISDLLEDGIAIETTSMEIWYFHNSPNSIEDSDADTITVEAFEVADGVTTVPPGAEPVARMVATVHGDDRELDSRIDLNYGTTPSGMFIDNIYYACGEMYLRFKPEPGAKTYTVRIRNVGGQGAEHNTNQDFKYRGSSHDVFIDPAAIGGGPIQEDGYTPDWHGVCTWKVGDDFASQPHVLAPRYDRENDEYMVHLFTYMDHPYDTLSLEVAVGLWHDWLENATFEVVVNR